MRYIKLKLSNKSKNKILLEEHIKLSKEKVDKIKSIGISSITIITHNVYDVNQYLKFSNIIGVTIERIETFDDDVHITYFKKDEYHTVVVPKKLLNKKIEYSASLPYTGEHKFIDYESENQIITWACKGKHKLKENEVLIRVS